MLKSFLSRRLVEYYEYHDLFLDKLFDLIKESYKTEISNDQLYYNDEYSIEEYNSYLCEIYIIALYKKTEINLKSIAVLIWSADKEKLFLFNQLKSVYKKNGIDLESIRSFNKLDELRLINNCIKHSGFIDEKLHQNNSKWKEKKKIKISEKEIQRLEKHLSIFYKDLIKRIHLIS